MPVRGLQIVKLGPQQLGAGARIDRVVLEVDHAFERVAIFVSQANIDADGRFAGSRPGTRLAPVRIFSNVLSSTKK